MLLITQVWQDPVMAPSTGSWRHSIPLWHLPFGSSWSPEWPRFSVWSRGCWSHSRDVRVLPLQKYLQRRLSPWSASLQCSTPVRQIGAREEQNLTPSTKSMSWRLDQCKEVCLSQSGLATHPVASFQGSWAIARTCWVKEAVLLLFPLLPSCSFHLETWTHPFTRLTLSRSPGEPVQLLYQAISRSLFPLLK